MLFTQRLVLFNGDGDQAEWTRAECWQRQATPALRYQLSLCAWAYARGCLSPLPLPAAGVQLLPPSCTEQEEVLRGTSLSPG